MKKNITEKDVYRACLILSIIGLGMIHLSLSYIEAEEVDIGEIEHSWISKSVNISGNVTSHTKLKNIAFIQLKDSTGKIEVVDFETRNISDQISVKGAVSVHQGGLQVEADKIRNLTGD
jgi:RecJ-like exonuclease